MANVGGDDRDDGEADDKAPAGGALAWPAARRLERQLRPVIVPSQRASQSPGRGRCNKLHACR